MSLCVILSLFAEVTVSIPKVETEHTDTKIKYFFFRLIRYLRYTFYYICSWLFRFYIVTETRSTQPR